jgi:pyridoxine/pyridoxamine 5'-phosphate oxidase
MKLDDVFAFVASKRLAVVTTVTPDCAPQAALVGFALAPDRSLVFDTVAGSRRIANLRQNRRVAVVVGWDEETTVQIEGIARDPDQSAGAAAIAAYLAAWPDGRPRAGWPDIRYVVIRPTWLRYCCYLGAPGIFEHSVLPD